MKKRIAIIAAAVLIVIVTVLLTMHFMPEKKPEQQENVMEAPVFGVVTDSDGEPLTASVEIVDLATGKKSRIQTNLLGKYNLTLPIGEYEFTFLKGFEHERQTIKVSVKDRLKVACEPVVLNRSVDWQAMGWYCGDLHQHTTYSDGYQDIGDVFVSDLANGLNWGLVTDHNSVDGMVEWRRAGGLFSNRSNEQFVTLPGMEVTTEKGHYNSLGSDVLIDHSTDEGAKDIERIAEQIQAVGGLAQVNHPFLTDTMGFTEWDLIDKFNTIEIWNGKGVTNEDTNLLAKEKWFEMLNGGLFLPATGGSDNHDISGSYPWRRSDESEASAMWIERGLYSGMPRNYVYCPDGCTAEAVLSAVREGHSFITNGPLIQLTLGGATLGEHVKAGDKLMLNIRLYDWRGLKTASLIEDGIVIKTFSVDGKNDITLEEDVTTKSGSWYVLEVIGEAGGYAITNPVFAD